MTASLRTRSVLSPFGYYALALALLHTGCTRLEESKTNPTSEPAASDPAPEPGAPTREPADTPTAVTTSTVAAPPSFESALAPLVEGGSPSADSSATAWTHYKAEQYAQAQRHFALASLHDRTHWKHPFNLACASALHHDELGVRVALFEAVARGGGQVGEKARRDGDLAAYRDAPWFELILDGVFPVSPPPPELADPIPTGIPEPLPRAKVAEIRAELKRRNGVEVRTRGSLMATSTEGDPIAFIIYDYRLYDQCMAENEAFIRESCVDDLHPEDLGNNELGNQSECVEQFLIRVELGTVMNFGDPVALEVACAPSRVRRLERLDIDGDGAQEVVLDTIAKTPTTDHAGDSSDTEGGVWNRARQFAVLRLDGSVQYEFSIDADAELPFGTITRVFARDVDSDGHLDLIRQSTDATFWDPQYCEPEQIDLDFWPSCEFDMFGPVQTQVLRYDPQTDAWPEREPSG